MDPLKPNSTVLTKLGSIAVHAEELTGPTGHHFDMTALRGLLDDPQIQEWLEAMRGMALVPVKRSE